MSSLSLCLRVALLLSTSTFFQCCGSGVGLPTANSYVIRTTTTNYNHLVRTLSHESLRQKTSFVGNRPRTTRSIVCAGGDDPEQSRLFLSSKITSPPSLENIDTERAPSSSSDDTAGVHSSPSTKHDDEDDESLFDEEEDGDEDTIAIAIDHDDEDDGSTTAPENHRRLGLPRGTINGCFIVETYESVAADFDADHLWSIVSDVDRKRLRLTIRNVTVPVALMMLDPNEFPTMSKARKACRKSRIVLMNRERPAPAAGRGGEQLDVSSTSATALRQAKVGDRFYPGDVLARQVRISDGTYLQSTRHRKPPFEVPVVYEDDHLAIVNKPAGIVVYGQKYHHDGIMTVRTALPFVLTPPKIGTFSALHRPQPVHRLDKPTSGLLVVAKTKDALVHLSRQFKERRVLKTYVAIVSGVPPRRSEKNVESTETLKYGHGAPRTDTGDDDPNYRESDSDETWQLIDEPLDEKYSVTTWRVVKYARSLKAIRNRVTMVELKPKTGRYHQLRRHMAWTCKCPIVGDREYDGGSPAAMRLRSRGLFLCSNQVSLEHPFYNSEEGRKVFVRNDTKYDENMMKGLTISEEGNIVVSVSIEVPDKFENFMTREENRYDRLVGDRKQCDDDIDEECCH